VGFEIRGSRFSGGGRPLERERAEYFRLMALGWSSKAACRAVGVNCRTGKRWRNGTSPSPGRKGSPPAWPRPRSRPESGRYLGEEERIRIADLLLRGASLRAIAAELGRSPSTVSREVRRNTQPGSEGYRPHAAQVMARARRLRPRPGKIARCRELRAAVQGMLKVSWSPEQIAVMLRRQFPGRPEMHVCHETIYQALYVQGRGELRRELAAALRTGRARRTPRRQAQQRRPRFTDPMVMISDRPAEAADRAVPGHWEGDLITGRNQASQIGTLVERATRYVLLVHLPADRTAATVRDALAAAMATLPAQLKRSLTWDQGAEMALHREFATAAGMPVYFCDPHSPWQRGSNENTNGLLRQYFPKGTDLSAHNRERLDAVATELNTRPRKTLDWDTPAQRLAKLLQSASVATTT
jgi:IS30 family transposase